MMYSTTMFITTTRMLLVSYVGSVELDSIIKGARLDSVHMHCAGEEPGLPVVILGRHVLELIYSASMLENI